MVGEDPIESMKGAAGFLLADFKLWGATAGGPIDQVGARSPRGVPASWWGPGLDPRVPGPWMGPAGLQWVPV